MHDELDRLEEPLTSALERSDFADLVAQKPALTVLHAAHVDGLAAAALWQRGAQAVGWDTPLWCPPKPGTAAVPPAAALALGPIAWPAHARLWPAVPVRECALWDKVGCASVWAWELWGAVTEAAPWAWVAALGCVQRAGRVPVPWLVQTRAQHTGKFILAAARLIDAAARVQAYQPALALQVLAQYETPRALVQSRDAPVRLLHAMRAEVDAAREGARYAEPYLAGRLAVVGMRSPCSLEDELAEAWAGHLPTYVVLVGNEGFTPGTVCYAAHTRSRIAVTDFLRSVGWPPECAARGVMPLRTWHHLLAQLRVPSGELPGLR